MTGFLKRYIKRIAILAPIAVAVVAALYFGGLLWHRQWYRDTYPYGWSHCCIKQFMFALEQYADTHDGHYPTGKESPEASLSLLHDQGIWALDANVLRGKTVPVEVVQAIFDEGGFLGPDTCGWHYVDGLTQNDDRRLAILWDKAGLGHNGEWYRNGEREVLFVGCGKERIPHAEWPKFLKEQEQLLANRDEFAVKGGPVLVGQIKLPSGELLDHYEGESHLEESWSGSSGYGSSSGGNLRLKWMRTHFQTDGEWTFVLRLPDLRLRSKPVTVKVENQIPSPNAFVFEME